MAGKPILVTGTQRSGTTWVGRLLSESPSVAYLWEPFHLDHDLGECAAQFRYQNTHVCALNEQPYLRHFQRTLAFKYALKDALSQAAGYRSLSRVARGQARFLYHRMRNSRPLLKDPRAVFSAEWLASRFDADVVVTIRHPAAFAASMKVKGWRFPFRDLLSQPLLMDRYLAEFSAEISQFARRRHEIVEEAALLWKIVYATVSDFQSRHPEWLFVRNEDLSRDPVAGFGSVFEHLGLRYSKAIQRKVRWHSGLMSGDMPLASHVDRAITDITRNSLANIESWKMRLTREEVARVKDRSGPIARIYYGDDEW